MKNRKKMPNSYKKVKKLLHYQKLFFVSEIIEIKLINQ